MKEKFNPELEEMLEIFNQYGQQVVKVSNKKNGVGYHILYGDNLLIHQNSYDILEKLFSCPENLKFDLTNLSNDDKNRIEKINGTLIDYSSFGLTNLVYLKLKSIGGDFYAPFARMLKYMENLQTVDRDFHAHNAHTIYFGNLQTVGRNLHVIKTTSLFLSVLKRIGGDLRTYNAENISISDLSSVHEIHVLKQNYEKMKKAINPSLHNRLIIIE